MKIKKKLETVIQVKKDKCGQNCDYLNIDPNEFINNSHTCNLFRRDQFIVPLKMDDNYIAYRCHQCIRHFGIWEV